MLPREADPDPGPSRWLAQGSCPAPAPRRCHRRGASRGGAQGRSRGTFPSSRLRARLAAGAVLCLLLLHLLWAALCVCPPPCPRPVSVSLSSTDGIRGVLSPPQPLGAVVRRVAGQCWLCPHSFLGSWVVVGGISGGNSWLGMGREWDTASALCWHFVTAEHPPGRCHCSAGMVDPQGMLILWDYQSLGASGLCWNQFPRAGLKEGHGMSHPAPQQLPGG